MWRRVAAIFFAASFMCGQASAQEITIRHGGLALSGEPRGFDGHYLRLLTAQGEVTLDYNLAECEGAACPDPDDFVPYLRLSGAARMADVLLPALIHGYARHHNLRATHRRIDARHFEYDITGKENGLPLLRFAFRVTDSAEGFADLLADEADIALSLREISPEEARLAEERGLGRLNDPAHAQVLALDALVPIVSPRRQMRHIDLDHLIGIFSGTLADWQALGQSPGAISRHTLEEESPPQAAFLSRFGAEILPEADMFHADRAALSHSVAMDGNGIGLTQFDSHGIAHPLAISGACGMEIAATRQSLKTGDYPLIRPLFMYVPQRRLPPMAERWRAWLRGEDAQKIIRRAGFVDRSIEAIPLAAQGNRLMQAITLAGGEVSLDDVQEMLRRLRPRERLSPTFRFEPGSTRLDAQSRANLLRLAMAIRGGAFDGRPLSLVGFSDGRGPAEANRTLSRARAETVRRALMRLLGGALPANVALELDAFGEMLPLACDDSPWGRQLNRRVELWVSRSAARP